MKIYNATSYLNCPYESITIAYQWEFFADTSSPETMKNVELDKVMEVAAKYQGTSNLIVNIEVWSLDHGNEATLHNNIEKYHQIARILKDNMWGTRISFYARPPNYNIDLAVSNYGSPDWQHFRRMNDALEPLSHFAGMVNPDVYIRYPDVKTTLLMTKRFIEQSYRYDKPVVPFTWHRNMDDTEAPIENYRAVIEYLNTRVDSLIVWDKSQYNGEWPCCGWTEILESVST